MSTLADAIADSFQQLTQAEAPYEIIQKELSGQNCRVYKQAPNSVKELIDAGRNHGDAIFVNYEGDEWSFNRFFKQVDAIGYQLANRYQIKAGDRVAIAMRNYPEWMTSFAAITSLGAIAVPLNSWGQKDELEYGLEDAGAKAVFCDQQRFDYICESLDKLEIKAVVVRHSKEIDHKHAETLDSFITGVDDVDIPSFNSEGEDPAMILYTSGTTGNPKGAISSHRNMIQAIINFEFSAISSAMVNPKAIEAMFASGNPPCSLLAVPLFHVSGLYPMFLLSLRGGRKIVMMHKWNPSEALKIIEREKITTLSAAPNMVMDVLGHPEFDNHDTSSLFALGSGGAATPTRFSELVREKMDTAYAGTGYGMTENNATCSNCTGEAFSYKPKSSGILSPIVDFKTCDEGGNSLPKGDTGEIWIKSPTVVKGYWKNEAATNETFVDGWLRTGDIGYIDEENFVFLVDRAKDIIIRGGENISAAEIENCLYDHPAVWEVAAFSVPNSSYGEEVAVSINCKPDKQTDQQDIQQFVKDRLAGFKVPSIIVFREDPMPRNAAGKIIKKEIRDSYLAG
jgi:acyl-CoA synthetase (AMP-forming)/AMP-acid ligase II